MNYSDFSRLCSACDSYLKKAPHDLARVSNAWLHVLRPHPEILKKYEISNQLKSIYLVKIFFRNILYLIFNLLKSFSCEMSVDRRIGGKKFDVVFVSHLINGAHLDQRNDFYFGNLSEELSAYGFKSLTILVDHTRSASRGRKSFVTFEGDSRILLPRNSSFRNELSIFGSLIFDGFRLAWEACRVRDSFCRYVGLRAAFEATSPETIKASRLGSMVASVVRATGSRLVVSTFEGHSWERAVFGNVRLQSDDVICCGYQHSVIFKSQHAIIRRLAPTFVPDFILTSGNVSRSVFIKLGDYSINDVLVLGSNRRAKLPTRKSGRSGMITCLVLPEGFMSETRRLFDFAFECSKILPEMRFIFRVHPSVDFDTVFSGCSGRDESLTGDNIVLSTNTLESDIERSDCALYRGSTSIIQACAFGIVPIYLSSKSEVSIDPLHGAELFVNHVANVADFEAVAANFNFDSTNEKLRSYCDDVFSELNSSQLISLIQRVG
jgi:hypothetical protein